MLINLLFIFSSSAGSRRQSNLGRYGSLKDLSHKVQEVTQRLTSASATTAGRKNKNQEAEKEAQMDVAAAPCEYGCWEISFVVFCSYNIKNNNGIATVNFTFFTAVK